MSQVKEILVERGNRYGDFDKRALLTQRLKAVFQEHSCSFRGMTPSMIEALDMIFHKIGRIGNGDPFYDDSWIDIAGCAQLVVDELHKEQK